jgi:hypothetical protein
MFDASTDERHRSQEPESAWFTRVHLPEANVDTADIEGFTRELNQLVARYGIMPIDATTRKVAHLCKTTEPVTFKAHPCGVENMYILTF